MRKLSLGTREICLLTKDLLKGKLCSIVFWSFSSFRLKKQFSFKSKLDVCLKVQWRKCVCASDVFSVRALMR